jgi:two-component system copper resistance phosphate regulon response regulator CusR
MRVLLLEDDVELRTLIVKRLEREGFAVDAVETQRQADDLLRIYDYDCWVFDRLVPDGDGIELVQKRRVEGDATPVLFLTARHELSERVAGFEAGGDDYVTKPFELSELTVRVQALCRRGRWLRPTVEHIGDLEIDRAARVVRRSDVLIDLTPKEFAVLEVLAESVGAVVGRGELMDRCWDRHVDMFTNSVNVHIAALRRKLGDPPLIRTVRGGGYALDGGPGT